MQNVEVKNAAVDQDREHWRAERAYWFERMRDWYRDRYDLALCDVQSDDAATPDGALVNSIQDGRKANPDAFFATGYRTMLLYLEELHDWGVDPASLSSVLEMGVGLGRLLRHWSPFPAALYGCDITPPVVEFCRSVLGGRAEIARNGEDPPLPYESAQFDFAYANSVFTHIREEKIEGWISELARVVRPGGLAIVSIFDPNVHLAHLSERELDRALQDSGGSYTWGNDTVRESFRHASDALHRAQWSASFEVLEIRTHFKDQRHLILRRYPG